MDFRVFIDVVMRIATAQEILALELLAVELELARARSVVACEESPGSAPRYDGTSVTRSDRHGLLSHADVVEDGASDDRSSARDIEHAPDRDFATPAGVFVFERAPITARAARGGDLRADF